MIFGYFFLVSSIVIGACVGSFLNVVIYRVPRNMSVNKPSRSFCPGCKEPIPWWRNIPIFTWILQRGKCAGCGGEIAVRYLMVEVLTAVLFTAVWMVNPGLPALLAWIFVALLVSISFIDGEHYVIPVVWCWVASGIAIVGGYFIPHGVLRIPWEQTGYFSLEKLALSSPFPKVNEASALSGLYQSFFGFALGYLVLAGVVLLGKFLFGKKKTTLEAPEKWYLKDPETDEDQLQFVLGNENLDWGEVFFRKTDRILLEGSDFKIDGESVEGSDLIIRENVIEIGEQSFSIEAMKSAEGMAKEIVIPREAMGGGDPPFLAMIGAFLGPMAVIFTLFTSSVYAIIAAILGRVGFGKPLPFGPFMALGALTWMFGGYKLAGWYLSMFKIY